MGEAEKDGWLVQRSVGDADVTGRAPSLTVRETQQYVLFPLAGDAALHGITLVRAQLKVAVLMADVIDAENIFWWPAKLWSEIANFRLAVTEMLDSGMPPLLHLVAFVEASDTAVLATSGLAFFFGQELCLADPGNLPRTDQVRRLARLSLDMMMNGSISVRRNFPVLLAGETICLEPLAATDCGETPMLSVRIESQRIPSAGAVRRAVGRGISCTISSRCHCSNGANSAPSFTLYRVKT